MFVLDFKPQFYSYPLDYRQYARIKFRSRELQLQMNRLQAEIYEIKNTSNYDKYSHYLNRLQQKIAILKQQQHQYGQILSIHQNIDQQLKQNKKQQIQVKNKILQQYKAIINARKLQKIAQKANRIQIQKNCLIANSKYQSKNLNNEQKKNISQLYQINPQKNIYNKFRRPSQNLLNFKNVDNDDKKIRKSQQSSPLLKTNNIKLPVISHSIRFSNYSQISKKDLQKINLKRNNQSQIF